MGSVDSQKYSPIMEKRNFKDLLEEEVVTVEEDLITKIFSQTVQVSPSDDAPESYALPADPAALSDDKATAAEVPTDASEFQPEDYDKVPTDLSHFNSTIVDLDDQEEEGGEQEQEAENEVSHTNTPSTMSPVDEQLEIQDFEEIERITLGDLIQEADDEQIVYPVDEEEVCDVENEETAPVSEIPTENIPEELVTEEIIEPELTYDTDNILTEDAVDCHTTVDEEEPPSLEITSSHAIKCEENIVSSGGVVQTEKRKTVTKVVTSSVTTSVQEQQESSFIETTTEEGGLEKKDSVRKSKKGKKGRAGEKENISVVPRIESRGNPYSPSTIGIFCSVRELSKLYEERQQLTSRPRRPFIKEDIMQINLNVKNMCRSFLDLTQYSTTTMTTTMPTSSYQSLTYRSHNGHPSSTEKRLFQRSKSITDLRRYHHHSHHHQHHIHHQHPCTTFGQYDKGSAISDASRISRQLSGSVFFLQKLLFFENWRRCAEKAGDDDNGPCKQIHCPHCSSCSLRSEASKGSLPPKKIRISIMQFDMKSSFSKFDALQKKAAAAAVAQPPHGCGSSSIGLEPNSVRCTACEKVVYQMEQMKAENRFWHKNCFRCTTCNKPLSVDTYQSHEAVLYCKPHFKQLFSPKTVLESEDAQDGRENRGPEMIIRESQPTALPEGVVRATDKVEDALTLDDLNRLKNVKQAFEMFEKQRDTDGKPVELSAHKVEKSPSIINKLAQFQKKISRENNRSSRRKGVPADDLNGEPQESNMSDTSSCYSSDGDEPPEGVDVDLWRARKATTKSDPIPHCADLDDLKKRFEGNNAETERRERHEERREEIKRIRSRLFMGKQAKIKEQYQQAVLDSEFVSNADGDLGGRRHGEATAPGNIKEKMQQLGECDEPAVNTTKQKLLEMKSENQLELDELRRQKQRDNLEIKSKFESGIEKSPSCRADDPELMAQMVENGIAKMSRNIFLEIDKQAAQQTGPKSPLLMQTPPLRKSTSLAMVQTPPADVVNKGDEDVDGNAVVIDTKDLQKKFEFFEKYQDQDRSPKKTINVSRFKDTSAVKDMFENNQIQNRKRPESTEDMSAVESNTTKRMLNLFRDIESGANRPSDDGPRPLKAFTPPPDGGRRLYDNGNENDDQDGDSDPGVTDNSDIESEDEDALKKRIGKYDDEILERAKQEARAQKLRAKFEKWETEQIRLEREAAEQNTRKEFLDPTQLESATNLRQKFEFMSKGDISQSNSPRKAVNRFV